LTDLIRNRDHQSQASLIIIDKPSFQVYIFSHASFQGVCASIEAKRQDEDKMDDQLNSLKEPLQRLRREGKILIAILYGSFSRGEQHARSDIDLALYLNPENEREEIEIIAEETLSGPS
jgi:predicted nucleotidyltransferase